MSELEDQLIFQVRAVGLPTPVREFKPWYPQRAFAYDLAFLAHDFLVDIQGGIWARGKSGHTSGLGVRDDAIKHNLAALSGYRVLLITPDMIKSGLALDFITLALSGNAANKFAAGDAQLRNRVKSAGLKSVKRFYK